MRQKTIPNEVPAPPLSSSNLRESRPPHGILVACIVTASLVLAVSACTVRNGQPRGPWHGPPVVREQAHGIPVLATGFGAAAEQARENAVVSAVEQVAGQYVRAESALRDDKYTEEIHRFAAGCLDSFRVLSTRQLEDGSWKVSILAVVTTQRVYDELLARRLVVDQKVSGADLVSEAKVRAATRRRYNEQAHAILGDLLDGFPETYMHLKPKGDLRVVEGDSRLGEHASRAEVICEIEYELEFDEQRYRESFLPSLLPLLSDLARSSHTGGAEWNATAYNNTMHWGVNYGAFEDPRLGAEAGLHPVLVFTGFGAGPTPRFNPQNAGLINVPSGGAPYVVEKPGAPNAIHCSWFLVDSALANAFTWAHLGNGRVLHAVLELQDADRRAVAQVAAPVEVPGVGHFDAPEQRFFISGRSSKSPGHNRTAIASIPMRIWTITHGKAGVAWSSGLGVVFRFPLRYDQLERVEKLHPRIEVR